MQKKTAIVTARMTPKMITTKQRFKKTDGRQFYHFVQSLSADDDLTPEVGVYAKFDTQ